MLTLADQLPSRVLPVRALLATVVVSLGVAWWLVPSRHELVERLMLDQQYERFAELLHSVGDDASREELSSLSRDEVTLLTTLLRLTPKEQLHTIFNPARPPAYNRYLHAMVIANIRYVDIIAPEEAWKLISPHLSRMTASQALELARTLSSLSQGVGRNDLAATIWGTVLKLPNASLAEVQQAALVYRMAGRPLQGARLVHTWIRSHAKQASAADLGQAGELCASMALEGGDAALALDVSLTTRGAAKDSAPSKAEIERLDTYAAHAGRAEAITPLVQRYLKSLPEAKLSLRQLHESSLNSPSALADYQRWTLRVAQQADWKSEFDAAFDQHLRLAAMNKLESLDRCLALTDFLGRDDETAELLLTLGSVPERPDLPLILANMLAGLGRDEEARPLFEQWLKQHPDDRDPAWGYACLLEDLGEEDAALTAFESLLQHHPKDMPGLRKLAENYIRADRHADALALYTRMPASAHDEGTLENYRLLAESQGDRTQLLAAQTLTARRFNTPESWLDIAASGRQMEDSDPAIALLQEGLQKLPDCAPLRIATAELLAQEEEPEQAVALLLHPSLQGSYAGAVALIGLSESAPDRLDVLRFLGDDVEKKLPLPPQARLDLAVLCYTCGQARRSDDLFESIQPSPELLVPIAEARYACGTLDAAEAMMLRHVKDARRATADDWVFLGDIYEAQGRDDDARNAYQFSLSLLTSDLPDTAFREPSSGSPPSAPQVPSPSP